MPETPENIQYSQKVLEHFSSPHNVGEIPDADGIGNVGNPICGDVMRLYIKVQDGKIVDAKFKTFGCLPAYEKVVVSKGGWQQISTLDKFDSVINSKGEQTFVAETYVRDYEGKLIQIIPFVSPFNSFSVTAEHPILSIKREWVNRARHYGPKCDWLCVERDNLFSTKPNFIKASQLSEGDYLIFNVNNKIKDNKLFSKDIMQLLGYYLSEGYISAQGSVVSFAFNKKEKKLIKNIKVLLKRIIGKRPKIRIRDNVAEVYVCSRRLVRFLIQHCKKIARYKSLSEDILLLPFSKQWEMVKTYLDGDGNIYRRRPFNSQTYRIITTSESIAIQIQEILARGGIFASLRQRFIRNCYINNRRLKDSTQYIISFKLKRGHKFVHYNNKYFLVPIRKIIRKDFRGPVYNFQVSNEPNSYLVKGFAVHNCGAAIATSSMVTDLVKGKSIDEALQISNKAVAEALGGLPKIKMHCSVLAEEALRAAIKDYRKKQNK